MNIQVEPQVEAMLETVPHFWKTIKGGKILFFCQNGKATHFAYPIVSTEEFWEEVGRDRQVREITDRYFSDQPVRFCVKEKGMFQKITPSIFPKCQGCKFEEKTI